VTGDRWPVTDAGYLNNHQNAPFGRKAIWKHGVQSNQETETVEWKMNVD
jgi:hypothetical protein